jgi:hypothetical protein
MPDFYGAWIEFSNYDPKTCIRFHVNIFCFLSKTDVTCLSFFKWMPPVYTFHSQDLLAKLKPRIFLTSKRLLLCRIYVRFIWVRELPENIYICIKFQINTFSSENGCYILKLRGLYRNRIGTDYLNECSIRCRSSSVTCMQNFGWCALFFPPE